MKSLLRYCLLHTKCRQSSIAQFYNPQVPTTTCDTLLCWLSCDTCQPNIQYQTKAPNIALLARHIQAIFQEAYITEQELYLSLPNIKKKYQTTLSHPEASLSNADEGWETIFYKVFNELLLQGAILAVTTEEEGHLPWTHFRVGHLGSN